MDDEEEKQVAIKELAFTLRYWLRDARWANGEGLPSRCRELSAAITDVEAVVGRLREVYDPIPYDRSL